MCRNFITTLLYRPCGHREEEELITDCDNLMEGNCAGIIQTYMGSQSRRNVPCPVCARLAAEQKQLEQVQEEPEQNVVENEGQQSGKDET